MTSIYSYATSNDYSSMTFDELVAEEKKVKSQKITTALFIGALVGVAVWSAAHKGSAFLTFGLLILGLVIGSRYLKNLKTSRQK